MKRICMDFIQPIPLWQHYLRIGILGCGALALLYSIMQQQQVTDEKKAVLWQRNNLTQLGSRKQTIIPTVAQAGAEQEAIKRANVILQQLNQPWDRLFSTLEQAIGPGISILAIAPEQNKSIITITAVAPNMDAAIDFIERLQASGLFTDVHLVNQEVFPENRRQPLQLTINARTGALK